MFDIHINISGRKPELQSLNDTMCGEKQCALDLRGSNHIGLYLNYTWLIRGYTIVIRPAWSFGQEASK